MFNFPLDFIGLYQYNPILGEGFEKVRVVLFCKSPGCLKSLAIGVLRDGLFRRRVMKCVKVVRVMRSRRLLVLGVFVFFALGASSAQATTILLSTHSSEISVDADLLDAELGFSIVMDAWAGGVVNKDWTLTHSVENLTSAPAAFSIDQIYFNIDLASALIIDIAGSGLGNWSLAYDYDNLGGDGGFGKFDIRLASTSEVIGSGETKTFEINIETTYEATLTDASFVALSAPQGEQPLAYGVAKFKQGPEDASAYGANVPEPATMCLLALGGLMLRKRRA